MDTEYEHEGFNCLSLFIISSSSDLEVILLIEILFRRLSVHMSVEKLEIRKQKNKVEVLKINNIPINRKQQQNLPTK